MSQLSGQAKAFATRGGGPARLRGEDYLAFVHMLVPMKSALHNLLIIQSLALILLATRPSSQYATPKSKIFCLQPTEPCVPTHAVYMCTIFFLS